MAYSAIDAQIGISLAAQLTALAIPKVGLVQFTFDPYHESDNLPPNTKIWITTNDLNRVLTSRKVWTKQCSLLLYMITPVAPTDFALIDDWLGTYDTILDSVESIEAAGNLPYEIMQEEQIDRDRLNNDKRLVCNSIINYKLI